jgi:hypothetical protein
MKVDCCCSIIADSYSQVFGVAKFLFQSMHNRKDIAIYLSNREISTAYLAWPYYGPVEAIHTFGLLNDS